MLRTLIKTCSDCQPAVSILFWSQSDKYFHTKLGSNSPICVAKSHTFFLSYLKIFLNFAY